MPDARQVQSKLVMADINRGTGQITKRARHARERATLLSVTYSTRPNLLNLIMNELIRARVIPVSFANTARFVIV
jgi:hypothetical protein